MRREYKHVPDVYTESVTQDINPPFDPQAIEVQYSKTKQAVYVCKGSGILMYITKPEHEVMWQAFINNAKAIHGVDVNSDFFTFNTQDHAPKH
jgi:hypothetical protein